MESPPRVNLLVSFAYLRGDEVFFDLIRALTPYANIMIDSGAFTNRTRWANFIKGKAARVDYITLDEYIRACQTDFHGKVWGYVALDKIGDPVETANNLQRMLDAGLRPMPVLTPGFTDKDVEDTVAVNPRVCSGGMVGNTARYPIYTLQRIFDASGGRALIHALGYTSFPEVLRLPISTFDSSSYCSGSRYGNISVFSERTGIDACSWHELDSPKGRAALGLLLKCGVSVRDMHKAEAYSGLTGLTAFATTFAHVRYQRFAWEKSEKLYYLAAPNAPWLAVALATYYASRGSWFDYELARNIFIQVREDIKSNPSRAIDTCVMMAKEGGK